MTKNLKPVLKIVVPVALVLILAVVLFVYPGILTEKDDSPEVVTASTLEKIAQTSDLSTFTSVYNGIAEVHDSSNADKVLYYVAYEASVDAGIDFSKVSFTDVKNEDGTHVFTAHIPKTYLMEPQVAAENMEFIFRDKSANTTAVTAQALTACEKDAKEESEKQTAILDLAQENAELIIRALLEPFLEQLGPEYELVLETES